MRYSLLLSIILFWSSSLSTQNITFLNPSFEGTPRHSHAPRDWTDCGDPNESAPDVQPDLTFMVLKRAYDGNTYLGMVTRDNDTQEAVGTHLSAPLEQGACYGFGLVLARSTRYISISRTKSRPADYIAATKLLVWGGNDFCDRAELLATSLLIENQDWEVYKFKLWPQEGSYTHLVFEVEHTSHDPLPSNGNLLLDAASEIVPLPACDLAEYSYTIPPTSPLDKQNEDQEQQQRRQLERQQERQQQQSDLILTTPITTAE